MLYLDDDVWLEPGVLDRLHRVLLELGRGFVAAVMQGLSHLDDRRPHEHDAANGIHLAEQLGLDTGELPAPERWLPYKIAWAAGCVLFDRGRSLMPAASTSGVSSRPDAHGEDVLGQQRVMARQGGAGILPSGAYHQQSPTTLPTRSDSALDVLGA